MKRTTVPRPLRTSLLEKRRYRDVIRTAVGIRANNEKGKLGLGGEPGRVNAQRNCNTNSINDTTSNALPTVVRGAISHHYFFLQDSTLLFKTVEVPTRKPIFTDNP